ncbi:glycine dehydrogenase [Chromobacterium alticapitis]|uniref:Glycine dehydrogenase n=1 Tax=Chromobacterium alticapitis TaxID=2073169 RepID=A0A2S5DCZ8_9NEIS|nr:glycine dehydrogenase [Chromobacterium alticapitis]POZ60970.1 glycine dehydrogenase [Chromobacterium alticapitis]
MSHSVLSPEHTQQQVDALSGQVLARVPALLDTAGKCLNDSQQLKLASHVRAMARRSLTGEGLPDFDRSLFDEISPVAMRLSQDVVALFGNLPSDEALLLSIHFEMAQNQA